MLQADRWGLITEGLKYSLAGNSDDSIAASLFFISYFWAGSDIPHVAVLVL
jgi:hypothetical protein